MTLTITVPHILKTRTFGVEKDGDLYILRGARGAVYGAVRFVDNPDHHLHIMKVRGACLSPFPGVVLTDVGGELRQV